MKFVTVRDLRNKSAQIRQYLSKEKEIVLTSNGKPFAIMTSASEENLEKSLRLGDTISGHFVMGHVDVVGIVKKAARLGADISLTIKVPKKIIKYLAYKGSVSVNGVSLTIAGRGKDWLKVCLVGHTLKITNLGRLKVKDKVNLEVDTIARYLENLLKK